MECPACHSDTPARARFCPECGAVVQPGPDLDATILDRSLGEATLPSRGATPPASGLSSSIPDEGFAPGTMVSGRYRIVGRLGRGGMGDVYRADDLTLGQSVALKFLPDQFLAQDTRRARFYQEVRIAREVAHANVCRVYDIGEVDGRLFLSMEYVDGEDLQSLLRRIGRLSQEKAVELARQLCAGLTALHDKGVLHRDLKPANVMLDGRGRVRITDFGLAGVAATIEGAEIRSGTPAYMAPEQLAGREVTVQSDLYSLGLILYELFTGRPAFQADTVAELSRLHAESAPSSITTHISDIDPVIDRVIGRCLEKDPARRPVSAVALAAALPGGDPLAAALAAGETPSPELVAASGGEGGVRPALAIAMFLALVAGVVLYAGLGTRGKVHRYVEIEKPLGELRIRVRDLCAAVGYSDHPYDEVHGFGTNNAWLSYLAEHDTTRERWSRLSERPSGVVYWYRQSPDQLNPEGPGQQKGYADPPFTVARMVRVLLEPDGKLLSFMAIPPESLSDTNPSVTWTWSTFFAAASLDSTRFEVAEPEWIPSSYADERLAWTGTFPDEPDLPIRIEAGRVGNLPTYWVVRGEWSDESRTEVGKQSPRWKDPEHWGNLLFLAALFGAFVLAWRNVRDGRGDIRGAYRTAVFITILMALDWVLRTTVPEESNQVSDWVLIGTSFNMFIGALVFALYLALEPMVRRRWPSALVAWARLLQGAARDPLVGRAILLGGVAYLLLTLLDISHDLIAHWMGQAPPRPQNINWGTLAGPAAWLRVVANGVVNGMLQPMLFFVLLLLLRIPLRKSWLASAAFILLFAVQEIGTSDSWPLDLAFGLASSGLTLWFLTRWGLLASTFAFTLVHVMVRFPISLQPTAAYHDPAWFAISVVVGLGALALWAALAGRSVWHSALGD